MHGGHLGGHFAASVLRVTGDANQAWLDANINVGTVTIQEIMDQKYIESFTTNQAYADWRRTGMPALSISAGAVLSSIPTRFPYAQGELDYNTENVKCLFGKSNGHCKRFYRGEVLVLT